MTAILRTLVVTLGLLLLSPWQVAQAASGTQPRVAVATCLVAACQPSDGSSVRLAGAERSAPAIVAASTGDMSPDDGCEPSRPKDGLPAERRATSCIESKRPLLGRAEPDGPERPPKAGTRIST